MAAARKAAAPEPEKAPEPAPDTVESVDPDARFDSALDEAGQQAVAKSTPNQDPDRVAMLSIRADGTPDQYEPELIGDRPDEG